MSHSLAKKFDKIVSKLGSKHKDGKSSAAGDGHGDESAGDGHADAHHESSAKPKHGAGKGDRAHSADGAPPLHVIADDLRDSPFKGKPSLLIFRSGYRYD